MSGRRAHVHVTFDPEGRSVFVMEGTLLLEAAVRAGITLDTPCGGKGSCGKCGVEVVSDPPPPTEDDRRHLSDDELARGARLACRTRVERDMRVHVPIAARFFDQKVLTDGAGAKVRLQPSARKYRLKLDPPDIGDLRSDADRLRARLRPKGAEPVLDVLRSLPKTLRDSGFEATAVVAERRLIAVEPGNTSGDNYGVAFDIGTTTVVGFLLDLKRGRELAVGARANPQTRFGDDVIHRIQHATDAPNGLWDLQNGIVECLNEIVEECCGEAGVAPDHVYEAVIAGNTTMNHLFLGVHPEFVAQAPYVAALRRSVNAPARDVGLRIHPHGLVHTLPNIAGFVGGDTVGVILSTGMHEAEGMSLAIDIGTNGELVIGNRDRLIACSAAAGPAFEGARIRHGMRAAQGAVDQVVINDDVEYNVIGDIPPHGMCGTGLIDAVAELLRVGAIEMTGRLLSADEASSSTPDAVRRRLIEHDGAAAFQIASADETGLDGPLILTQRDVRELQLAKGAIRAGATILLKEAGVEAKDLERVLLAGAFGSFLRRSMARRIGLLPDAPSDRVSCVGNAAGAGARMALLSTRCKKTADRISERTEYLELAARPDFQEEFASAMLFPEA